MNKARIFNSKMVQFLRQNSTETFLGIFNHCESRLGYHQIVSDPENAFLLTICLPRQKSALLHCSFKKNLLLKKENPFSS